MANDNDGSAVFGQALLSSANARTVIAVACTFGALAVLSTFARLYSRWRYVGLKLDDWFMFVATLFYLVLCIAATVAAKNATDAPGITFSNVELAVDMLNVGEMFYILTLMVLKISISLFYLQFLQTRAQRLVIYTAVSVSTTVSLATFLFVIFQCGYYHGAEEFIEKKLANQCTSPATSAGMIYAHATVTMLTDWTFLLMPVWLVRGGSSMTIKSKVWLGLFLLFASMAGIASIARFPYIYTMIAPGLGFFAMGKDIVIWSILEPSIGIIAACLIVVRPLFRHIILRKEPHSYTTNDLERRAPSAPRTHDDNYSFTTMGETIPEEPAPETKEKVRHPAFLNAPDQHDHFPRPSKVNRLFSLSRRDLREPGLPMAFFTAPLMSRTRSTNTSRPTTARSDKTSISLGRNRSRSRSRSRARSHHRRRTTLGSDVSEPPVPRLPAHYPPVPKLKKPSSFVPAATARKTFFAPKRTSTGAGFPLGLFESSSSHNVSDEK